MIVFHPLIRHVYQVWAWFQSFQGPNTWVGSSTSASSTAGSESTTWSLSFSIGLNRTFFISLSLMSGLAALMSTFRLAVGDHGSARPAHLMGVMWARSEVDAFRLTRKTGTPDSDGFSGVDLLLSKHTFSCNTERVWWESGTFVLVVRLRKLKVGLKTFCRILLDAVD